MDINELRVIWKDERESAQLTQLPHNIVNAFRNRLNEVNARIGSEADPLSNETQLAVEEACAYIEMLTDIFTERRVKIISLARLPAPTRDELRRMLPFEMDLFVAIGDAIDAETKAICDTFGVDHIEIPFQPREIQQQITAIPQAIPQATPQAEPVQKPAPVKVVRILMDLEDFMGLDGRTYSLMKEDVVTLPALNAEVLIEHKMAEEIVIS